MEYASALKRYDDLVDQCDRFERKGKTMPYTSANGHMFSLLTKAGELGFRFDNKIQEHYFEKYQTSYLISYNSKMKGYILIKEEMFDDQENLLKLLNESYDYVMSLEPK